MAVRDEFTEFILLNGTGALTGGIVEAARVAVKFFTCENKDSSM